MIGQSVFIIIIVFIALYVILPFVITRILGIGVIRKGENSQEVAFTFDDGPNPVYTPLLLDLLRKYGVKATFFVLGEKAAAYPELIRRMQREGHLIGVHNYTHRMNILMPPWVVRQDVKRSADVIKSITGKRPHYYRPPWGIFSLPDLLLIKRYTFTIWSVMSFDWRRDTAEKKLKDKLMRQLAYTLNLKKEGAIVLLHDCGNTWGADSEAPKYMLLALEKVLSELKSNAIHYVRLDQMTLASSEMHDVNEAVELPL
ncbi:polysaccharide deacetylase family protein [Paenibacillus aestuarii]|uniref:Polysaccharide deacetylase family protein n=1 Tax=Paenibacillus aestuarii TaxID=516965 RepID=A0ABW0KI79_9BACL|nr:polysaccharide deacetylase family protein [Paenibacillus aestuarii]